MIKRTDKEERFVRWVKKQCRKHGVKCKLKNVSYLRLSGNIRCSGYFDDATSDSPTLVVAMNRRDWVEILVHEYCHLTQWLDQESIWTKAGDSLPLIDEWLSGVEVPDIEKHLGVARDLELDNEKRSVALMRKWNLDVDIGLYIQKANAYIQFYNYLGKTRRWSNPVNAPYGNETIRNAMPADFSMNYKKMGKRLEKLFENENI
jgi:hypothetical protein